MSSIQIGEITIQEWCLTLMKFMSFYRADEIEKYKQKDIIEEMMSKLLADYPDVSQVFINKRDIFLTHSLQIAAEHPVPQINKSRQILVAHFCFLLQKGIFSYY